MGLFKPAWMGDNDAKALKSVEKEENQSKLYKIAKNANNLKARYEAVKKIIDQAVLADMAKNDSEVNVRNEARYRLNALQDGTIQNDNR